MFPSPQKQYIYIYFLYQCVYMSVWWLGSWWSRPGLVWGHWMSEWNVLWFLQGDKLERRVSIWAWTVWCDGVVRFIRCCVFPLCAVLSSWPRSAGFDRMLWSFGLVLEETHVSESSPVANELMTGKPHSELIFPIAFSAAQCFPVLLFANSFSKRVDELVTVFL